MFVKIIYFIDEFLTLFNSIKSRDMDLEDFEAICQLRKQHKKIVVLLYIHFFLDDNLKRLYPMNTYIKSLGINISFDNIPKSISTYFDIDLSKYGYSDCPTFLAKLIQGIK